MLSVVRSATPDFERLRSSEFSYLDEQRLCYLDYTGSALAARSQRDAQERAMRGVFGNPHSQHAPSRRSTDAIETARARVLRFLDADPAEYTVCFTANASAAIKLVAESFPFRAGSTLLLSRDNHNSVNGIREFAIRGRARVQTIPLDDELRMLRPRRALTDSRVSSASLFAFPAQSNFSGVRHPLSLVADAQQLGFRVLLDGAAYVPSSPLSLRTVRPDFLVLSMYKLFGFPSGVGALVARHDALGELTRPWFAGGTVEWASTVHRLHRLRGGVEGFEDGTPNFHAIAAVPAGLDFLESTGMPSIRDHVAHLTSISLRLLRSRRHPNGRPLFHIYGPLDATRRGGTIAFNALNSSGAVVDYETMERHAAERGVAVRGGCFCNPGAAESAFRFDSLRLRRCLGSARSGPFSPRILGDCLGHGTVAGALRLSVGLASTEADVERAIAELASRLLPEA